MHKWSECSHYNIIKECAYAIVTFAAAVALLLLAGCDPRPDGAAVNTAPPVESPTGSSAAPSVAPSASPSVAPPADTTPATAGEYADRINNQLPIGPSGEVISREFYGGIYFDEGILTIMVLDEAYSHAPSAAAIAEMLEHGFKVTSAIFTDHDLCAAIDTLNNLLFSGVPKAGAVIMHLDTKGNKIVIGLDPYNDEQKALLLDLLFEESVASAMIEITPAVTQEMLDKRAADITAATQSSGDKIVLAGDVEVSRTGIMFSLENLSGLDFCYGAQWDMAYYEQGRWIPVPHMPGAGNQFWPDIGYGLQSGGVEFFRQEWDWYFGELPPGRYMYIREGWLGDRPDGSNNTCALIEFFISEDSPASLPPE